MHTCLYIAEGEIEQRFLTELKQLGYIIPGKFRKFNLMQKRVKDSDDVVSRRYSRIICIVDSDCANDSQLDNLNYNLNKFKNISKNLNVLVQNKNFEDELGRLMQVNNLLKAFNSEFDGIKDLKKFLAQKIVYSHRLISANIEQYGREYSEFEDNFIKKFPTYKDKNLFISGKDIMSRK